MKREIKFRAWWQHKVYEPEGKMYFVGGLLNATQQEGEPEFDDWGIPKEIALMERKNGCKLGWNNAKDCILMQYTGLKDKNGKEIYEGDIIQEVLEIAGHQFNPIKYEVVFGEYNIGDDGGSIPLYFSTQGFALRFINDDGYKGLNQKDTLEVIGNIYENPELLNNNKYE